MRVVGDYLADFDVPNPKNYADPGLVLDKKLYPYYAGYSRSFAEAALAELGAQPGQTVFDPWNGGGTTTAAAKKIGCNAIGLDLNPVMVIVAKASMVTFSEVAWFFKKYRKNIAKFDLRRPMPSLGDPLLDWLTPASVGSFRALQLSVKELLANKSNNEHEDDISGLIGLTPLEAFVSVIFFRVARALLIEFVPTNPTWVKKPRSPQARKRPTALRIAMEFLCQFEMMERLKLRENPDEVESVVSCTFDVGDSRSVRLDNGVVDYVLTSPPYCTRIDYAVATSIELAVLGVGQDQFSEIRKSLMGTSTVGQDLIASDREWGTTCLDFLAEIGRHPSKASATYYLKTHVQYFDSLFRSIKEIGRVLKVGGKAVLVVQDSHYKNLRNDVASVVVEMAKNFGLVLSARRDYEAARSMAHINNHVRRYRGTGSAVESVLCFTRY